MKTRKLSNFAMKSQTFYAKLIDNSFFAIYNKNTFYIFSKFYVISRISIMEN